MNWKKILSIIHTIIMYNFYSLLKGFCFQNFRIPFRFRLILICRFDSTHRLCIQHLLSIYFCKFKEFVVNSTLQRTQRRSESWSERFFSDLTVKVRFDQGKCSVGIILCNLTYRYNWQVDIKPDLTNLDLSLHVYGLRERDLGRIVVRVWI